MRIISTLFILVLFFALGIFIAQNTHRVPLTYFWSEWDVPLRVVVLVPLVLGLVYALVAQVLERVGAERKTRRLEKKLRELEQEVERLRGAEDA
ncbi:MAG: DUF1049 domain-containing protein [Acidobacteriota bacterium]|nr:MAG: DUF1049 domain-containing protein [Acidobacteriota bacterium]